MRSLRLLSFAVLGWTLLSTQPGQAQAGQTPLKLTAFAINMSNVATGANAQVDININRWSTEAERQKLIRRSSRRARTNSRRAAGSETGWLFRCRTARLRPALRASDPASRTAAADSDPDRSADPRVRSTRAAAEMDHPFTLIEVRPQEGRHGEGKIPVAPKITLNKKDNTVN